MFEQLKNNLESQGRLLTAAHCCAENLISAHELIIPNSLLDQLQQSPSPVLLTHVPVGMQRLDPTARHRFFGAASRQAGLDSPFATSVPTDESVQRFWTEL
jgi:hypothetical protein